MRYPFIAVCVCVCFELMYGCGFQEALRRKSLLRQNDVEDYMRRIHLNKLRQDEKISHLKEVCVLSMYVNLNHDVCQSESRCTYDNVYFIKLLRRPCSCK